MSTIKLAIIKSFHFLMRNDFTSGKQKNRKALRCVSNWIVSQSIDCGIYYHYGNETLHILQQWKWEATLRSFTLHYHQESYNANLLLGVMTVTTIFIWRCVLLQKHSSKALPRKSATVVRYFLLIFQSLNISFFFVLQLFGNSRGTKLV